MTPGGHCTQGSNCVSSEKSRSNRNVLHVSLTSISTEMTAILLSIRIYTHWNIYVYISVYICIIGINTHRHTQQSELLAYYIKIKPGFLYNKIDVSTLEVLRLNPVRHMKPRLSFQFLFSNSVA